MKTLTNQFALIFMTLPLALIHAQKTKTQEVPVSVSSISATSIEPFRKGSISFMLNRPVGLHFGSNKFDGEKTSGYRDINIRGNGTYFVEDGIGVGANINIERDKRIDADNIDFATINSEFLIEFHGVYGKNLGSLNGYVQPSVGFGFDKSKYESGSISNESKDNIFRAGLKAGVLVPLGGENNGTYITPNVGWNYTRYTNDENSDNQNTTSRLFIGAGLTVIIPSIDIPCDCNTNFDFVSDRFSEGNNILEFNNRFNLSNYTYRSEYKDGFSGSTIEDEDSQLDFNISVGYKRAVIDRLFVGANININTDNYDYKEDPSYTVSGTDFNFGPSVEYYPLDQTKLSNTFVGADISFGSSKTKTDSDGTLSESKYSRTSFDLHLGYDYGFTPKISLVSKVGYETSQIKNEDSDVKSSNGGIYYELGTRFRFDFQ